MTVGEGQPKSIKVDQIGPWDGLWPIIDPNSPAGVKWLLPHELIRHHLGPDDLGGVVTNVNTKFKPDSRKVTQLLSPEGTVVEVPLGSLLIIYMTQS